MANEVPSVSVRVAQEQAALAVASALEKRLGEAPSRSLALYALALAWVETGRGNFVCNSPGNVMARGIRDGKEYSVWSGDYWRPDWYDANWSKAEMREGKWPSAFRAYPTLVDGFADFAAAIVARQLLVKAMRRGNPREVALALRDSKYSPDYGASHASIFASLVAGFRKAGLLGHLSDSGSDSSAAIVLLVGGVLVLGGSFVAARYL